MRGGPALAPGPHDLPLQYVDVRDLAAFLVDAAEQRTAGIYDIAGPSGHATMGTLLQACAAVTGGQAVLHWVTPAAIRSAGISPWAQLPIWLPPGPAHHLFHEGHTAKALAAGLRTRPVEETVADTWAWLGSLPGLPSRRRKNDPPAPSSCPRDRPYRRPFAATARRRPGSARRPDEWVTSGTGVVMGAPDFAHGRACGLIRLRSGRRLSRSSPVRPRHAARYRRKPAINSNKT